LVIRFITINEILPNEVEISLGVRSRGSFKIILECYKWLFRIIWINFSKNTDGTNLFKNCGSHFYLMINLVKEVLEDIINADYKKVLDLLEKEKPALSYTLGKKIVQNKLNWWPLRFFETSKDLAQM
jgi:hypothetical protein